MLFIFDMGGVVTSTFNIEILTKQINLSKKEFFERCKINGNIWCRLEKGEISTREFWSLFNSIKDDFKVPKVEHDLFRLYFHPEINLKTLEIINFLKKKHRVVCGTNTIDSHWENHMERGDYSYFHQTYASNKIGESKPNPNFFKLILEAENQCPQETFFVDDKAENCQAARSLGINAEVFVSAEELLKKWENYF